MDQPAIPNGTINGHPNASPPNATTALVNGYHDHEPSQEDLERELPVVYDGQIQLGDLLSRVVQGVYAELSELAETMPNMSDAARKRILADWVVKTKKQVVKLYAVAKWARDADTVQKCMNITAFLMTQNQQFNDAIQGLTYAKESLDPARLRNHDLLTSLDVLTTGSYRRLPTGIKKLIEPPSPLTDSEVLQTLRDMEDTIRYRIRMSELIPVEMIRHRIADGRIYFTVPKLFETSLCLRGAGKDEGWFFVHVEFLITIGGDLTGMHEFPREPTGPLRRHITDEADARLAYYLPLPEPQEPPPPGVEPPPPRPTLSEGMVDTPLVRVFNFLQMMSLSYQLEILWYQAQRMRSLGWADYLKVEMSGNRKSLLVSYWVRPSPPQIPGRPTPPNRSKLPPQGGTLSISIVPTQASPLTGSGPARSCKARVLADLQVRAKLGEGGRASDEIEGLRFEVKWEATKGALGIWVNPEDVQIKDSELVVDPDNLDFESMLRTVIEKHTKAIFNAFQMQLQRGPAHIIFSPPGVVSIVQEGNSHVLHTHLVADEMAITSIDPRTGRLSLRDTGDLAAAGRGPRFTVFTEKLNENPAMLIQILIGMRIHTITDLAEQKANYLGLQSFRTRNFAREELQKLGPAARGTLYIQLHNFPSHYLVLVITDEEFRYALISVETLSETMYANLIMKDIGWLDIRRIHGEDVNVTSRPGQPEPDTGQKRKRDGSNEGPDLSRSSFHLETQVLRELYAYCCARVAYTKVEQQFKLRGIPYKHVNPTSGSPIPTELTHIQSSLARSVPALCVQSSDILSGAPAAEAAMPNIRVIPLNWWSDKKAQVVTCVKLKYVQQPMGKRAGASIIRPSKRVIYDTTEAVVSFLSENVDTCVDEFLEEWARVSKMVVIAREVAQMAKVPKWADVRLLSFDLQTVEFAYASDYCVSISCTDQLSFDLRFSRCRPSSSATTATATHDPFNPHDDAEPFLRSLLRLRHGRLAPSLHRLVGLLRDTLPVVVELHSWSGSGAGGVETFAKAAGWYRVLYPDLRHAIDFRLMTGGRVVLLDGSYSLFARSSSTTTSTNISTDNDSGTSLQLIPNFPDIILDAIRDVGTAGTVPIDVGVVCDAGAVRAVGRAVHERVRAKLGV